MGRASGSLYQMLTQPIEVGRQYDKGKLRADMVAGLSVAVIAVPQSMAYALIAGVSPVYGLYTVIVQALIGSLFNSNPFLSVGPTNTQSLLVASIVTRVAQTGDEALYLQLVVGLTLIKGLMQMGFAAARLGRMVRYVSQSVVVGFTAGAGVLIATGQLGNFLGIQVERGAGDLPGLLGHVQRLWSAWGGFDSLSMLSVVLGVGTLVVVIASRMISRLIPGPLLAVVLTAMAAWLLGWTGEDPRVIGELPTDWAEVFAIPVLSLDQIESLLSGAVALSLLGLMEAYSIGKAIGAKTGQRIMADQELLSQGFTHFVSSFFHCIPGSGSFSRSALNHYAGARTIYAGVFNSLFVAAIFFVFAPIAKYIPLACLAAVLFVIAYGLIEWRQFVRIMRADRADAVVCVATFVSTLVIPLEYAVVVGIFLNIALYLRRASRLHLAEMVRTSGGPYLEVPIHDRAGRQAVIFLQLEGDLFFGVADELQIRLNDLAAGGAKVVILRLKRTHSVDATVLHVLEQFANNMHTRGGHVVLCGVKPELMDVMAAYGLIETIGPENVFQTQFGVFTSAKQALLRARQLLGRSIDDDAIAKSEGDETEGWAYEI